MVTDGVEYYDVDATGEVVRRRRPRARASRHDLICGPPAGCKNAAFMADAGGDSGAGRCGGSRSWASLLMVLGTFGWWLSTRVLDADGFADVVAKASQREEVRDYIADQATLRLARTSNFVSAARPVVTDAVSAAIATPPVEDGDPRLRASARTSRCSRRAAPGGSTSTRRRRRSRSAARCRRSTRRSRRSCRQRARRDRPRSRSPSTVDLLFRTSRWVEDLYLPVVPRRGRRCSSLAMVKARDRVHAHPRGRRDAGGRRRAAARGRRRDARVRRRSPGPTTRCAATRSPRSSRCSSAGSSAPGRRSSSSASCSRSRPGTTAATSTTGWSGCGRGSRRSAPQPRWRFAGGLGAHGRSRCARSRSRRRCSARSLRRGRGRSCSTSASWSASAPAGCSSPTTRSTQLHKRQVVGVFAAMIVGDRVHRAPSPSALVAGNTDQPRANPTNQGCNGYIELCAQPLNQIVWPASHNAMSSARVQLPRRRAHDHDPRAAERRRPLPDARRVLRLRRQRARAHQPRRRRRTASSSARSAATTRCASSTGRRAHRRRRHVGQEAGRLLLPRLLRARRGAGEPGVPRHRRLPRPQPHRRRDPRRRGLRAAEGPQAGARSTPASSTGCGGRARSRSAGRSLVRHGRAAEERRTTENAAPAHRDEREARRRAARGSSAPTTSRRRRRSRSRRSPQFNCKPNRGGDDKSFFIVNHWLRPNGPPDPVEAGKVELAEGAHRSDCSSASRARSSSRTRSRSTSPRSATSTRPSTCSTRPSPDSPGVTATSSKTVSQLRSREDITDAEVTELNGSTASRRSRRRRRARCSARSPTASPHRATCRSSPTRARPAPGRPPRRRARPTAKRPTSDAEAAPRTTHDHHPGTAPRAASAD